MSRDRKTKGRSELYDKSMDCGTYSLTRDTKTPDEIRTISEVHCCPDPICTYGLFAGHRGMTAADLCARNFVPTLIGDSSLQSDPERAIRNACETLEAFVIAKSNIDKVDYGTTLLFAMIKDLTLFVANVGNSRAVLFTDDGVQTITQEHDGSNASEVARVRNAGGFFEDGKVNNLIPVTRSIGNAELKTRRGVAFPEQKMAGDVLLATPDVYCRQLSTRDNCLILATAEIWEHLSNKVVVRHIQEALKNQQSPRAAAKKVALAAMHAGATGPLSVMVLVLPTARTYDDRPHSPSKKRTSRPTDLRKYSSNEEEQLNSPQDRKGFSNTPSFARTAQAEAEQDNTSERSASTVSPTASPKGSTIFQTNEKGQIPSVQRVTANMVSTSFSTVDVPPTRNLKADSDNDHLDISQRRIQERHEPLGKLADSVHGIESISSCPDDESDHACSRQQIDMERKAPVLKQKYNDRKRMSSARAKTAVASRFSELTVSEITGDEVFVLDSLEQEKTEFRDFIDTIPSGPSKVRYGEDGSIHTGPFGFFKDLGRAFGRKR